MAQWRPNPQMYGEGGGEFVDDNGQVWPDPWGTLNTQAQAPAPGVNTGAPTSAGGGGELPAPPAGLTEFIAAQNPPPAGPPGTHETEPPAPGLDTPEGMTAALDAPMPDPAASRGLADRGGGAGAPDPAASRGLADQDTQQTTSSGTSSESGSTGLSQEAAARQGANITAVAGQQTKAVDAGVAQGNLAADQAGERSKMLLADSAKNIEKAAADLAVNDHIQNQVNRKMQAGSDWRPDRAELFHGDNGVGFGISAAVAAMAGAWMQGRGLTGSNPYLPTIMKMIDDNVQDQVRKNSTSMQYLREQKGDLKAAQIELKQKQLHYAQQRLDGLALKDSSELLRAGVEKTRQDMLAQNAKWEQEKRQALERTETHKVTQTLSQSTRPSTGVPGGERTPEQAKAQSVLDTANRAYLSAGLIRDRTGRWVVGGGALPPAVMESFNPFSDNTIHSNMEALTEAYGRLQSGGVIGAEERPEFRSQVGLETMTRAQLAAKANALETSLQARLRSKDAAASPGRQDKINDPDTGAF